MENDWNEVCQCMGIKFTSEVLVWNLCGYWDGVAKIVRIKFGEL